MRWHRVHIPLFIYQHGKIRELPCSEPFPALYFPLAVQSPELHTVLQVWSNKSISKDTFKLVAFQDSIIPMTRCFYYSDCILSHLLSLGFLNEQYSDSSIGISDWDSSRKHVPLPSDVVPSPWLHSARNSAGKTNNPRIFLSIFLNATTTKLKMQKAGGDSNTMLLSMSVFCHWALMHIQFCTNVLKLVILDTVTSIGRNNEKLYSFKRHPFPEAS